MGWFWGSNATSSQTTTTTNSPPSSIPPPSTTNTPSTTTPPPVAAPSKPLSRDVEAEAELQAFLSSLNQDSNSTSKSTPTQPQTQTTSTTTTTTTTSTPNNNPQSQPLQPQGPRPITSADINLTEISCRTAFDYAFFCQSLGGQLSNVYRYGELRSCSDHWDDFWLCMRSKGLDDEERRKVVLKHYEERSKKWKMGPCSEDVWEARRVMVREPFTGDLREAERVEREEREREKVAGLKK